MPSATDIRILVKQKSDARLDETVEKLLVILRNRHTHQCWRKECGCEYCRFINGEYVNAKMVLHQLKKRVRHYEYLFYLTDTEMHSMMSVEMLAARQKAAIKCLKKHKKALQTNVL